VRLTTSAKTLDIRDFEIGGKWQVLTAVSLYLVRCFIGRVVPKFAKVRGAFETPETHSTPYNIPETLLKIVFVSNSL
jgi:hypothetical protein